MNKKIFNISLISFFMVLIDQIIKIIVSFNLSIYDSINVIKGFFNITYVTNNGAAWSILSGNRFLLIIIAIVVINLIYFYLIKDNNLNKLEIFTYGVLIGGIIGNLCDRIIYGYVIDYLDFKIFSYDFPVFNFADICIVISMLMLALSIFKGSGELDENHS